MNRYRFSASIALLLTTAVLTGCMVGPVYHSPHSPKTCHYLPRPTVKRTTATADLASAGKSQSFHFCQDLPAQWWRLFHSQTLNCLIKQGLAANPNVAAAKASLLQAQENLNAQIGSTLWPALSFQAQGERARSPLSASTSGAALTGGGSPVFNLFNSAVSVSYTLDFFGKLRRQIEASSAQANQAWFELEATYLTLTSNIATTVFTIASLNGQIAATKSLIKEQTRLLNIINKQFVLGGVSKANVYSQQTLLEQTRATLPPLLQNLSLNQHLLSILIGELPSQKAAPKLSLDALKLPEDLPLSIPSLLVKHRPDIRAAEEQLHFASAQIGVATANLFPNVTITGAYGFQSSLVGSLVGSQAKYWNYILGLTQPLFYGGSLLAERRASIAAYQNAAANYRETVLQGFKNVADSLRALEHDAESLNRLRNAEIASFKALKLTEQQYLLGAVTYINLLNAQQLYLQNRINRIIAQASRYTDTVALFQALGGGWWNRPIECHPLLMRNVAQYKPGCFGCF